MPRLPSLTAMLLAGAAACASGPAAAIDAEPTHRAPISPDQPLPRSGAYQIESQGETVIFAKCAEGGYAVVPVRPAAPLKGGAPATRDAALRDACKNIDYTK